MLGGESLWPEGVTEARFVHVLQQAFVWHTRGVQKGKRKRFRCKSRQGGRFCWVADVAREKFQVHI